VNCDVPPTAGAAPVTAIETTVGDGLVEHPASAAPTASTPTHIINRRIIALSSYMKCRRMASG
jgi:hypothetical protein